VGTPEARFGHATHSPPSGSSARRSDGNRRSSSAERVTNMTATSKRPRACVRTSTPGGSFPSVRAKSFGASIRPTRASSLIPSFLGSGVPEYPATYSDLFTRLSGIR
jgi:hypothetical protein